MKKLFFLFFLAFFASVFSAELHGLVYSWDGFDAVENAIVSINTVPVQSIVAKNGVYFFNVSDGNFVLTAFAFDEFTGEKLTVSKKIIVEQDGNYIIDLILVPEEVFESSERFVDDFNEISLIGEEKLFKSAFKKKEVKSENEFNFLIPFSIFLIFVFLIVFLFFKFKNNNSSLLNDKNVLLILQKLNDSGSRLTQKELREKTGLGETHLSLILAELESEKFIKKIKQGRGNIIILKKKLKKK